MGAPKIFPGNQSAGIGWRVFAGDLVDFVQVVQPLIAGLLLGEQAFTQGQRGGAGVGGVIMRKTQSQHKQQVLLSDGVQQEVQAFIHYLAAAGSLVLKAGFEASPGHSQHHGIEAVLFNLCQFASDFTGFKGLPKGFWPSVRKVMRRQDVGQCFAGMGGVC